MYFEENVLEAFLVSYPSAASMYYIGLGKGALHFGSLKSRHWRHRS